MLSSSPSPRPVRAALIACGVALSACQANHPFPAPRPATPDSVDVGYSRQAPRDVTGAVASLQGDATHRPQPTSMADLLDGRFAGVEVTRLANGGMSVRIRGQRSFKASGEPLYVVDGIPQHGIANGMLEDITPADVRSIEVLKDAGATAAYGARGANGVILISTIRPRTP